MTLPLHCQKSGIGFTGCAWLHRNVLGIQKELSYQRCFIGPRFSSTKRHPAFLSLLAISSTDHPILLRCDRVGNKQSKMSQYTIGDSNTNCLNTMNSYNTSNVWNNCTVAEDLSPLLTWLSPLDPGLRHSDIQERRVNNVGEWLMGTKEFSRWSGLSEGGKGDEVVLFYYRNPSVGKTFIR